MKAGFPVEVASKGGVYVTGWSDQMPQVISGIFGGHAYRAARPVTDLLMGMACQQCGFVELYKLSEAQLQQYLAAQQPQPSI